MKTLCKLLILLAIGCTAAFAQTPDRTPQFNVSFNPTTGSCFLYSAATGYWEATVPGSCGGGGGMIDPSQFVLWQNGIGSQFVAGDAQLKNWIAYTDGGGGQLAYHFAGADDTGAATLDAITITRDTNPGDCGPNTLDASVICSITLATQTMQQQIAGNRSGYGCDANDDCFLQVSNNSGGNKGFSHLGMGSSNVASAALVAVPTGATQRATADRVPECEQAITITPPYECVYAGDQLVVVVGSGATGRKATFNSTGLTMTSLLQLQPFIVSTLPVCNSTTTNAMAVVTDATSPTYNGTLSGSGTVHVPVFCNGTAWTSH